MRFGSNHGLNFVLSLEFLQFLFKNFKKRYENIIPKYYSYAIGSVIGLNRFLLMANLIEPQINSNHLNQDATNRQKHLMCNPRHLFSLVDEYMNMNETIAQMK